MVFDFSKLKGRIIEKYGSQVNFANAAGTSINTISLKLTNKTRISSEDIIRWSELLDIPTEEIGVYFFKVLSLKS